MPIRLAAWPTLGFVAVLAGAPPSTAPTLRARRAELAAADSAAASTSAADARALLDRASDDVVLLHPGLGVLRGRTAVAAALDSLHGGPLRALRWRAVRVDVSDAGDAGYTLGYGERRTAADSAAPIRYIAFWRRGRDARWRIAAITLSRGADVDPAPAPAGCDGLGADGALRGREGAVRDAGPVLAADRAFAERSAADGPAAAFGAFVAPDGILLGSEPMSCGRAPAMAAFAGAARGSLAWAPRLGFLASAGDLGFTVGVAEWRGAGGPSWSKYLTVWRRRRDGSWRFVVDGGSAAPSGG